MSIINNVNKAINNLEEEERKNLGELIQSLLSQKRDPKSLLSGIIASVQLKINVEYFSQAFNESLKNIDETTAQDIVSQLLDISKRSFDASLSAILSLLTNLIDEKNWQFVEDNNKEEKKEKLQNEKAKNENIKSFNELPEQIRNAMSKEAKETYIRNYNKNKQDNVDRSTSPATQTI